MQIFLQLFSIKFALFLILRKAHYSPTLQWMRLVLDFYTYLIWYFKKYS